ncbi:MAG: PD-(D/E)XK nuclease family protein, partial [Syntrophothermus sp.]
MILFKSPGPAVPFSELKNSQKSIRSEIIARKRPESVLILVPTKRKIRNLLREIIRSYPGSRSFGRINIATIETLAFDMLRKQEVIFREISAAVSLVLHSQCYEENKNSLRYFPKEGIPSGTLLKLKNVISEYKRHPITTLELMEEVEEKLFDEGEELKVKDIILLYEAYNRKCSSLSLKEIGDIYSDLNALDTAKIKNGFEKCFPSVETIIVEGYDNLTGSEIALLDRLSSCYDVFIDFDYSEKNENLFGHLTGTMETLTGQYGWKVFRDGEARGGEFKKHIAYGLSKVNSRKNEAFKGKIITEIEARDREKEVELIAREIKHILFDTTADVKKTEPHDICVVFKNISDYSSFIREKFEACRIPFNLTDRKMLSSSPPVLAVLNLLTIRSDNYYYKDIMRALSSGFISIRKKNGHYVDFNNLLETAGKLKIVSGYENWVSSLKEIIELIDTESKKPFGEIKDDDPDNYYDEDYVRRLGKDRLKFEWALEDLEEIHRLLKPLGEPQTPMEFKRNLFSLIRDTKVLYITLGDHSKKYFEEKEIPGTQEQEQVPDTEETDTGSVADNKSEQEPEPEAGYMFNLEENARGFDKFIETITDLLDLIGSIEEEKKYELEFYIRQIKTSVMRERYNLVQKSNYGVTVTTPEELRGLEFECLFIGGLVDNYFPTPYRPEVFVAESRKRENGKMSKPEIHQTGERYLFYQSLTSF